MLSIVVPGNEYYDEEKNEFIYSEGVELRLEHSLLSLAKWESKWRKPFLNNQDVTPEERIDYIRCMVVSPAKVGNDVIDRLTVDNVKEINDYIENPMTATVVNIRNTGRSSGRRHTKFTTSELLYYYMIELGIPFECEKWHLNRLITLIQVCNVEGSGDSKKMSRRDIMSQNAALNAARRAKGRTRG